MPKDQQLLSTAGEWIYGNCRVPVFPPGRRGATLTQEGGICQLCGNNNVLFVHTLEHPDNAQVVEVGLDCARILLGPEDEHLAVLAENETHRKRKWRFHYRRWGTCTTTIDDLDARGKL